MLREGQELNLQRSIMTCVTAKWLVVNVCFPQECALDFIAAIPPDQNADVVVWRDGRERKIAVKLGSLPDERTLARANGAAPMPTNEDALGLTFAPLDDASRRAAGVDESTKGVLIADVADDSPVAEKGVSAGAVLLAVAGEPVDSPKTAADKINAAEQSGRSAVLLLIRQNGSDRFVAATFKRG